MEYRKLSEQEIDRPLFAAFERRQQVGFCLRLADGVWKEEYCPFVDQWSEEDYGFLVSCLRHTVRTGGLVCGAFFHGELKGFCSVEGVPFGSRDQYYDLSSLHVSAEMRGHGIGRQLFCLAAQWAQAQGGKKLYISSHSAVETQAFYKAMGCVDALEQHREHTEREPFDRQLEFVLDSGRDS